MADTYKGLIIKIGGDTSELNRALKASNSAINTTQKQLRKLEKAAKLDSSGSAALNERLDVMGDKAQALTSKLKTMNNALKKLGTDEVKKLAAQTEDAAQKASKLTAEYADVVARIKKLKNEIASTNLGDAFNVNDVKTDPFTKLNEKGENLINTAKKVKRVIRELNGVSVNGKNDTEEVKEQIAAYERLVDEFKKVSKAKEQASNAASFKDMQVEIAATEAEARALYRQMARLASENPAAAQTEKFKILADKLNVLGDEALKAKQRLQGLDQAFELDPSNIEVARAKLRAMSDVIDTNKSRMAALRVQLKALDSDGSISKLANEGRNLASELYAANNRVANLNKKLDELKADNGLEAKGEQAENLTRKLEQARAKASQLSAAMKYSSVNAELQTLAGNTNALSNSLNKSLTASSRFRGMMQNVGWSLMSTVSPAVMMFGYYAVSSAEEVDSAYRNMRKTVQGTEQQFENLKQAAIEYSRTHVTSADEILEIEALGGQLGVATSKLEDFATVVSNLDIATDLDAETAAEQLGQLSGILNDMTDNDFAKYGDALTRLGNNNATLESKISDVMLRISSMGTISGFTTPQLLAWSTAVAATGQGAEAAGTAISKTMSDIEAAVGAGGDSLQGFADVAGMSATEFANTWKNDPSTAMQAFIQGLKNVETQGGSADNTLANLGITSVRQKQAILGLTQTIDGLNNNLTMSQDAWDGVSDEWGDAGDAAREAERKAEGFSGAIQLLRNNAQSLAIEMGDSLRPILEMVADVIQDLTAKYSAAPAAVKQFINALLLVVAGAGSSLVVISSLCNAFQTLSNAVKSTTAIKAASQGMNLAMTSASGLVTALQLVGEAYLTSASSSEKAAAKQMLAGEASKVAATGTKILSTALKALPWVAVAALATELISSLVSYSENTAKAKKATEGMKSALDAAKAGASEVGDIYYKSASEIVEGANEARDSQAELADSITDSINTVNANEGMLNAYVSTIQELAGACDGNAEKQVKLKAAVQGYNEITGESVRVTNSTTGALSVATDELVKNAEAWKLNAKAQAYQEAYSDAVKQQATNKAKLAEVDAKLSKEEDTLNQKLENGDGSFIENDKSVRDLKASKEQLEEQDESCGEMVNYLAGEIQNLQAEQAAVNGKTQEATDAANLYAAALGKTSDEFSTLVTETNKVIDGSEGMQQLFKDTGLTADEFAYSLQACGIEASDFASEMDAMADKVQNAFEEINVQDAISPEKLAETLQHNVEVTRNWATNIKELYKQAGDGAGKSFVDSIAEKGPEYAATVEALLGEGVDLQGIIALWQQAGEVIPGATAAGMGFSEETLIAKAKELGNKTSNAYTEGSNSTNAGQALIDELTTKLNEGIPTVSESASQVKQAVIQGATVTPDDVILATSGLSDGLGQSLTTAQSLGLSGGVGIGSAVSSGIQSTEGKNAQAGNQIASASEEEVTQAQQTFWHIGASVGSNYAAGIWSKTGEAGRAGSDVSYAAANACGNGSATAYQWGAHLGSNFAAGIWSKVSEAAQAGADLAAAAGESTHFSVPKKGIWSGAEKGGWRSGTHLVQNITQGIRDEIPELSAAASEAARAAAVALNGGRYQANLAAATTYAQGATTTKITVSANDASAAITDWLDKNLGTVIADNAPNLVIDNDAGRMVVDTRLSQLQRKAAMNRG